MAKENLFPSKKSNKDPDPTREPYFANEVYQAFMVGYVKRINDATLRVPIGGVRIGSAKYSRLAQINLHSRIITFSRYAIENVPERGRRYLVIHELSHVKEASHNKHFWNLVADHEPRYKEIGKELDQAFKKNVRSQTRQPKQNGPIYQTKLFPATRGDDWENFRESLITGPEGFNEEEAVDAADLELEEKLGLAGDPGLFYPLDSGVIAAGSNEVFNCNDNEFSAWDGQDGGIIYGGSESYDHLEDEHLEHY